ncbi:TIGR00266 family protein [Mollicutes bacterium LVI A0078]|nr:TIGR00266 family protein [Mollicutes bacterium LVI A0075]WOO91281.1 TIGR00266 family protein [Mollicutes bacterium LVI A0078]
MEYNILNESNFPVVEVTINNGEAFKLETGAMLSMTSGISLEGKRNGSLFGALGKAMLGGENFFVTTARANGINQKLTLAPKGFGAIRHIQLDGSRNWYLEDGVFLASDNTVDLSVIRQKGVASPLLGGTGGFFILKTSGAGNLFVESFGSIIELEVTPDNPITVDNNHVIGWEETVHHEMIIASGAFGFKTGEGLAIKLSGNGKVLIQTRQPEAFTQLIMPYIPQQR